MKATVDPALCTQCGLCVDLVPDVFEMGDDSAIVSVDEVPENLEAEVREAVDSCPEGAISVSE